MIQAKHRVAVGFALIAAGVIVAVIGWFGVSGETDVAFQLPFLASAGVGALLLFGAGATMLIAAQLESDTERLGDIEDAVRLLGSELGRLNEELATPGGRRLRAVKQKAAADG